MYNSLKGEMLSGSLALLVSSRDNCCWIPTTEMIILGILGRVFSGIIHSWDIRQVFFSKHRLKVVV